MTDAKAFFIEASKTYRKSLDDILQHMKLQKIGLMAGDSSDFEDKSEAIAQHTLSIRDLESAIMRQGMFLKNVHNEKPYPTSYDPSSSVVEKTADDLNL